MKVFVTLGASQTSGTHTFDMEDLNTTEEQWKKLSNYQKEKLITEAVDSLPEHPYWVAESFGERD